MKKYLNNNKNIIFLLCLFMIIQPFLDMKVLFENPHLQIFGITIPTIVRTLFICGIGLLTFLKSNNKKEKKWIIIYFIIVLIYSLIHHVVASRPLEVPPSFKYSIISEAFYVIRMILPLTIIYITKHAKIDYDKFINVILYSSMIIGLVIVISNTLLISYTSYGTDGVYTKANWFIWLIGGVSKYTFEELTSKGWFYMANQIAGLTLLLLPICINDMLKKINVKNVLAVISLTFAMIMLGTRTSAYGWLMAYVALVITPILFYLIKYIKTINFKPINILVLLFVVFLSILLVSPVQKRVYTRDLKPHIPSSDLEITGDIYKYIEDNYVGYGIQDMYIIDLYSYKYDPVFWLDVFERSKERILDNRDIELLISSRIMSRNEGRLYELFGYSFSRMRNGEIYIEKDFYAQKVTIGYIGLLVFILPYFYYIFKLVLTSLQNKKINLDLVAFLVSMIAAFGSSLFSGHILDELFVMLYVGFIIGYYLSTKKTKEMS